MDIAIGWIIYGSNPNRSKRFIFFFQNVKLGSGTTQSPIQWVPKLKRPGRESGYSPTSTKVKTKWSYVSAPPCALMAYTGGKFASFTFHLNNTGMTIGVISEVSRSLKQKPAFECCTDSVQFKLTNHISKEVSVLARNVALRYYTIVGRRFETNIETSGIDRTVAQKNGDLDCPAAKPDNSRPLFSYYSI